MKNIGETCMGEKSVVKNVTKLYVKKSVGESVWAKSVWAWFKSIWVKRVWVKSLRVQSL